VASQSFAAVTADAGATCAALTAAVAAAAAGPAAPAVSAVRLPTPALQLGAQQCCCCCCCSCCCCRAWYLSAVRSPDCYPDQGRTCCCGCACEAAAVASGLLACCSCFPQNGSWTSWALLQWPEQDACAESGCNQLVVLTLGLLSRSTQQGTANCMSDGGAGVQLQVQPDSHRTCLMNSTTINAC
jgi:hypothetical protein